MNGLYPWHQASWHSLTGRMQNEEMPHALLFCGPSGTGKNHFAQLLSRALLCQQRNKHGLPCGQCRNCLLTQAETHPDLRRLAPLEDKKIIGVDQVREITHYLSLTSQEAGFKIVIISPAEAMNINAANSLLKTLEEPSANSLLILVSHRPAALPATIRSRCQKIIFAKPDKGPALHWLSEQLNMAGKEANDAGLLLDLADGAPLLALELAASEFVVYRNDLLLDLEKLSLAQEDPLVLADKWLKLAAKESLYLMYGWIVDILRLRLAAEPPCLANGDIRGRLEKLGHGYSLSQLLRKQDQIADTIRYIDGSINSQLLMEELMIGWVTGSRQRNKLVRVGS